MLHLSKIPAEELNQTVKNLALQERKLTEQILWHIAEVDRRKLFLKMAYSSLFDYLTKEIGYSAGAAQRRIDAARLIQKIPEVALKIQTGSLQLNQISKVQKAQRLLKKSGTFKSLQEQRDLLSKLEGKNSTQTDLLIAQHFQVPIQTETKQQIQRDESVRLELTFSQEEMKVIRKAQELLSHQTGGGLKETLVALAEKLIQRQNSNNKSIEKVSVASPTATMTMMTVKTTATVAVKPTGALTPNLKQRVFHRDQCCQYKDRQTGKVCGSRYFLEVDHIKPRFVGGTNEFENLRTLCRNHNIYRYKTGT